MCFKTTKYLGKNDLFVLFVVALQNIYSCCTILIIDIYICVCICAILSYNFEKCYEELSQDRIQVCSTDVYVTIHLMFVSSI